MTAKYSYDRRMPPTTKLRLDDEGAKHETTWKEFSKDNEEDEETLDQVASLKKGESVSLGGGAGGGLKVTRLT